MPQWQSCFIGFLWGHSHSDWLPVSVLGYMEFFLAPKREVGPDSHYALLWRARKGYNAGSFWLGRAQLGLAQLRLAFPSILNFNEWQLHEQCSSVATVMMIFEQMKKSTEKLLIVWLWLRDEEGEERTQEDIVQKMKVCLMNTAHQLLQMRRQNPLNSSAAAAMTIIN